MRIRKGNRFFRFFFKFSSGIFILTLSKGVLAISLFHCYDNKWQLNSFLISTAFCNSSACHYYLPINMFRKLIHGIQLVFSCSQFNWCFYCFVIDSHSFVFTHMSVVAFSALWQRYSGSHTSFPSSMQHAQRSSGCSVSCVVPTCVQIYFIHDKGE